MPDCLSGNFREDQSTLPAGGRNRQPRSFRSDCVAAMPRSLETIRDEVLVLGAQAGDASAFEALLRHWLPVMRRHATRLTGDVEAGEEISQEACLALVGALPRLHDPARAHGWMLRIVTHKAADWVRRRKRDRQLSRTIQNREPRVVPSDFQREPESHERAALIRAACMHLPTDLRTVVSLYYGEGLPVAVIAEGLGGGPGQRCVARPGHRADH
jgi:RNA polymerase sigma-70 factor (ECF subfamily)